MCVNSSSPLLPRETSAEPEHQGIQRGCRRTRTSWQTRHAWPTWLSRPRGDARGARATGAERASWRCFGAPASRLLRLQAVPATRRNDGGV